MKLNLFNTYRREYRELLKLGAPVLVTQLGVITVSFADTMMVGAYGTEELAASALVNSLYVVPMVMLIGFAGGITPLIGSLYSRKAHFEVGRTLRAALQINVLLGLIFTALLGASYFLLDHLHQPEEIMPLVKPYYLIVLSTVVPMTLFNSLQQTANGVTDTLSPMIAIIAANVLNVLGNWVLIFGKFGFPEMGLNGAGISTLVSRLAGLAILSTIFCVRKRYSIYFGGLRTGGGLGQLRRTIFSTSWPVMVQGGIECAMWSFGTVVCGLFGKIQLAAYQVVNTMAQLGFMTYMSFATATSIRVANKTGLGDTPGVRKTAAAGIHLNLVLATIASLIFWFLGRPILYLFTPDEAVISEAVLLILPLVVYQYGDAIQYTYANAQRGTSQVRPLAIAAVVCYIIIGMPVLWWLAVTLDMETVGVFWSFNVALFAAALMLYLFFRHTVSRGLNQA